MNAVIKTIAPGLGLILAVFFAPLPGAAQEGGAVRDRDGKPYRIDGESGFRIKDHIADLEVQVDDLQRQVRALENELSDKQTTINRLSSGDTARSTITEKDIKTAGAVRRTSDSPVNSSCRSIVVPLNKRIDRLEQDLRLARQTTPTNRSASSQGEIVSCRAERDNLQMQVAKLQTALMDSPSKESYAREQQKRATQEKTLGGLKSTIENKQRMLEESEQTIARLESEIGSFKQQLSAKTAENKQLETRLAGLQNDLEKAGTVRARAKTSPIAVAAAQTRSSTAGNEQELKQAKLRLGKQLSSIQRLIGSRKDKLDALKSSGRGVSVSISPLKTKNNASLDSLRLKVRRMKFPEQEYQISSGLKEIEQVLRSDIGVLSRLAR